MRRTFVLGLLLLGALVAAGLVVAAGSSEPERPPWVAADGRLVPERLPAFFEVAGPDGAPVVCANGRRLKVRSANLFAPPPDPDRLAGPQRRPGAEETVWRCGMGPNPHLNPRTVPLSEDPLDASP
jgi:hypothetical protein